jgi:6-phosphogluconolactonase (cycloisomerase 2 family)
VIEPSGRFAYIVDNSSSGDNGIWVYSIDQSTGALSLVNGSPFGEASGILLAVSPNGKFLFNAGNGSITSYTFDNGRPVQAGTPLPGGENFFCCRPNLTGRLLVSSNSQFVYLLNEAANSLDKPADQLYVYAIAPSGVLTPIAGSPFTLDSKWLFNEMALTPDGRFLYLAAWDVLGDSGGTVRGFAIDTSSGAITGRIPGFPLIGNNGFFEVLADFSGKFLYVHNLSGGIVVTYTINADGAITQSSVLSDPIGVENVLGP